MTYGWTQFRCFMAEFAFNWALAWIPKGSKEEFAVCKAIAAYYDELGQ